MRVLALSSWWPEPADNGSRLRIAHLLRALARQHDVHLVALAQEPVTDVHHTRLAEVCASVVAVPERKWDLNRSAIFASVWRSEPASVREKYNHAFDDAVRSRAAAICPQVVVAFELDVAPYAKAVPGIPRILEEVELTLLLEQYELERNVRRRLRTGMTWWKHQQYVRHLLRDYDACTVVSRREHDQVQRLAPNAMPIEIIPNGADVHNQDAQQEEPAADTLIYPGSLTYDANYDAASYFIRDILPLIRQHHPHVRLKITGRTTASQREALASDAVDWTGWVPDIRPHITSAWAEVVPLRLGGGTRLKVLEALGLGTPVVSTSKGVEGLDLRNEREVLIADQPECFARATIRLLEDPSLRLSLATHGRQLVHDRYDWRGIGEQFNQLVVRTAKQRPV